MVSLAAEPFHSWHQLSPKSLSRMIPGVPRDRLSPLLLLWCYCQCDYSPGPLLTFQSLTLKEGILSTLDFYRFHGFYFSGMCMLGGGHVVYVSVSLCMCRWVCLCWENVVYAAYMVYVSVSMCVWGWTRQCDHQKKTLIIFLVLHSIPLRRGLSLTWCSRSWLGWLASELRTQACVVLNVGAVNLNSDPYTCTVSASIPLVR